MFYLLLCILSTTGIFATFKLLPKFNADTFKVIVFNYITASICGLLIFSDNKTLDNIYTAPWITFAIIIGISFISMFWFVGTASQKVGIAITTVSSKMSVVIPIVFSFYYFNESSSSLKIIAIIIAVIAVFFTVYKKEILKNKNNIYYPIILFIGSGIIDSMLKYSQEIYFKHDEKMLAIFTSIIFLISAIIGLIVGIYKGKTFFNDLIKKENIIPGVFLGVFNFGSIYFFIKALNSKFFIENSSIVLSANNMGVVLISVLLAMILFKEKLNSINLLGVIMSLISIYLLSIAG